MMVISKLAVQCAGLGGETTLSGGFPLQKQAAREGRLGARVALFSAITEPRACCDGPPGMLGHARGNKAPPAETRCALVILDLIVSFWQPSAHGMKSRPGSRH